MQSVPITTKVVCSNPAHGEMYSIHDVVKFLSDLRQVDGFLRVLRFPPPIKLTATHHVTEKFLKVALNILTPNPQSVPVDLDISHFIFKYLDILSQYIFQPLCRE